jgi:hypothetical protein
MKRTIVLAAAAALGLAACQEQLVAPPAAEEAGASFVLQSTAGGLSLMDRGAAELRLPAGAVQGEFAAAGAVARAINPGDYVCTSTPLQVWLNGKVADVLANDINAYIELFVFGDYLLPIYEAAFTPVDGPHSYGYNGAFTNVMNRTDRAARRFWDIDSDVIELVAAKGTMLADADRLAAAYQFFYGYPSGFATDLAEYVSGLVRNSPVLDGGNHPALSFNAVAIRFVDGTSRIVMGDGILEGYAELGWGDVAAPAIYAHEFAHHIQFQNGYFDDPFPTQAESTRYTELMADAMSAYFMTHKRGMAMNKHRVAGFLEAFFQIGDCGFGSSGHHGTPNQRMKAAQFGFAVADAAQKQGHILTSEQFYQLFVAEYDNLIAPDAF